jgi:hypothetical protein
VLNRNLAREHYRHLLDQTESKATGKEKTQSELLPTLLFYLEHGSSGLLRNICKLLLHWDSVTFQKSVACALLVVNSKHKKILISINKERLIEF